MNTKMSTIKEIERSTASENNNDRSDDEIISWTGERTRKKKKTERGKIGVSK